jgi:hypothetical protein
VGIEVEEFGGVLLGRVVCVAEEVEDVSQFKLNVVDLSLSVAVFVSISNSCGCFCLVDLRRALSFSSMAL